LGRIYQSLGDDELIALLGGLILLPTTVEVARRLGDLDFRSDPADELIAATSLAYGVPLLTRDSKILASRVVPLAVT